MAPDFLSPFLGKIRQRSAVVAVMGLGYVGLPLVQAFVEAGFEVIGFDIDESKIDQLRAGRSYIRHLSHEQVAQWLATQRFLPTSELPQLRAADAILICVPTPLQTGRVPDLRFVNQTTEQIATILRRGQLVVLESTTYPGTTREEVLPRLQQSGLQLGEDFLLAYSPEREDPGNPNHTTRQIPKVVGGIDEPSLAAAEALYREVVVEVVPVASPEIAEATKLLENVYRAVNIALVNELKIVFDRLDINIWEVIDAAKTKPFGFQAFYPGPGLGGHCIPIDPFYLSWLARRSGGSTRFIELAGEINSNMPHYVVERLILALNERGQAVKGSKICLIGVAYKPNVDDPRESPAFALLERLSALGAELSYIDPYIPQLPPMRNYQVPKLQAREPSPEFLAEQDAVVIVTNHREIDYQQLLACCRLIIDTRNALPGDHANVERA